METLSLKHVWNQTSFIFTGEMCVTMELLYCYRVFTENTYFYIYR